jgi:hypothetical protein
MRRYLRAGFMPMTLCFTVILLLSCTKSIETRKLNFSGKIIDDFTGEGVTGGGSIRVDGHDANAGTWFGVGFKENIGSGTIQNDGTFECSFNEWSNATDYYFYILYNNRDYIFHNTLYLDKSLFASGSYSQTVKAAKLTGFKIKFSNTSPFDTSDRLDITIFSEAVNLVFGGINKHYEDLQNCYEGQWGFIYGGANAHGTLACNVAADKKVQLMWYARKNNVSRQFYDSIYCPRNTTTIYNLNY